MTEPIKKTFTKTASHDAPAPDIARGVFCDIAGTLIGTDKFTRKSFVRPEVLGYLRHQTARGLPVTLISTVQDNALATGFGLTQEFGPIHGRALYRDKTFEILVDDQAETSKALKKINPKTAAGQATLARYKDLGEAGPPAP